MRNTILGLALATCAIPALAQTPPAPPPGAPMPPPGGGAMGAAMLLRADANGDGVVTREEALAAADARFDRLDADHDGVVTRDEMRMAREAMRGDRAGGAMPPPPAPPSSGNPPPPRPDGAGAPDGRGLTREASRTRALAAFDRADANHDGRVDATEMANLREARREMRDERRGDMPPPPPPSQR